LGIKNKSVISLINGALKVNSGQLAECFLLHNHSLSFMMQTAFGRAEESGDFMGRV
jgi:hypothetical protein